MYSTFQRLNQLSSLATTAVMVLLGLISLASWYHQPTLAPGKIDVKSLMITRGRNPSRWRSSEEDVLKLKFDVKADLTPVLQSYNTKQVFLYLLADYVDSVSQEAHEVVLWDRIVTRASGDFRSVDAFHDGRQKHRKTKTYKNAKLRLEGARNVYFWHQPSGKFDNVHLANLTLHYNVMPYVGLLTSGVAATAQGEVAIPKRDS